MMSIEVALTIWFILVITINLANVFYRIITERDPETSWKSDAIASLMSAIIHSILLVWMYLSWWI